MLQQQKGADHVVTHRHRLSLRKYPRDCPPVRPCWFHAVDLPKRRPRRIDGEKSTEEKPVAAPKKYAAFSIRDSKAIEAAFQELIEEEEAAEERHGARPLEDQSRANRGPNTSFQDDLRPGKVKVPVNEDYLFDVDVERRELGPAYWQGPIYDVRRGTWFYQDGSVQRPCDENLAAQLEEGYLKVKAWRIPSSQAASQERARSESQPRQRPTSWAPGQAPGPDSSMAQVASQLSSQSSDRDLRSRAMDPSRPKIDATSAPLEPVQTTYRLFGAHMNSVVTFQDGKTAWLLTDDFMSRMSSTMYQRFAGGSHFAGVKLTRGFVNPKHKDEKEDEEKLAASKQHPLSKLETDAESQDLNQSLPSPSETRRLNLERQMSSLLEDPSPEDAEKQERERRRRERREIEDDYREAEGDDQGREIEHLVLVTHGIGQRLGLRIESVNFVHDVNTLRKTLKAVYADSPDLRALNAELGNAETVNSRVQVLPICWRHLLDFPKQSLKHNRKELDIADSDIDDINFPSLEDITVEGVPAVRNLITDLALDILLYQSPAYKDHISRIVLSECNRIYHLFKERNPTFKGKISMVGHSLGSAIMFDILCRQGQAPHSTRSKRREQQEMRLDFEVEDFYALGSPIGLFQMLKGRNVVAREKADARKRPMTTSMDDPMLDTPPTSSRWSSNMAGNTSHLDNEVPVSSPKCSHIFNIFHPTDPISYRLEPLISPAMASLKPQPLPYTKRGIFGAPMGQGLTGIGARVSQSVSSMWSSMASSLLTRGLGYAGDDAGKAGNAQGPVKTNAPLSMGAGTNTAAGVVPTMPDKRLEQLANETIVAGEKGQHPPTLIDSEIETLYGGYQKRRSSAQADSEMRDLGAGAIKGTPEWADAEERAKKLRREEEKVRRLNSNGRVDYAIQEGVFDINLIAAIASHLSYWSDEDVSHFIISQLLSRHRVVRTRSASEGRRAI